MRKFALTVTAHTNIRMIRDLLEDKLGTSSDHYRLICRGYDMYDDKTLSDYNIRNHCSMYLLQRMSGGMYHITSGRQDFQRVPYGSAETINNILLFKFPNIRNGHQLSLPELQNSVLQAKVLLSDLYKNFSAASVAENVPHLKGVIMPPIADDDGSSDSEDDNSNDQ